MSLEPENLSPAQRAAFARLRFGLKALPFAYLHGEAGRGMSAVLAALAAAEKGHLLTARDFVPAKGAEHPLAFDDAALRVIATAVDRHECVIVDDFHRILEPAQYHYAPRHGWVESGLVALLEHVAAKGRRLLIGAACCLPEPLQQRGFGFSIPRFTIADYAFLLERWLGPLTEKLEVERVHRFAPKLDAHHLRACAEWWKQGGTYTTDAFIEVLRAQRLGSNVDLGEVQNVRLEELVGVEEAIQTLLRCIVLPHEEEQLAEELGLRAKRGVLLYGPPGTGKTTVGRALAHRLKGKFFLIDGTFIAGTSQFYQKIHQVFQAARENAPSVIFLDDADVIFENRGEQGLYRYLLTMLDGLESESNAQVTVMMTAMNLGDLPPALIRSGRVELWLEMRLPDAAARRLLLEREVAKLPPALRGEVSGVVLETTEGLTGADLKACVVDAKSLYAYDRQTGVTVKPLEAYLLQAVSLVRENKEKFEAALQLAMAKQRPAVMSPHDHWVPEIPSDDD